MNQLPQIRHTDIQAHLNREDIVLDTIAQVMKDFGLFGIEISFSGKIDQAYAELHAQLVAQIDQLLSQHSELLYSVLYQVDISQRDLQKSRVFFPDYSEVELLAHEVIYRDLKKVLYRRHFS